MQKEDFPQLKGHCYLDCAGSLPIPKPILDQSFADLSTELLGNPHSTNISSIHTKEKITKTKSRIYEYLNTNESMYSIVFTMNASHAIEKIGTCFQIEGKFVVLDRCHTSIIGLSPLLSQDCLVVKSEAEINAYTTPEQGLFAFPAQCNFTGQRYPLEWIPKMQKLGFKVLVDTASYASTTAINLSQLQPEFLVFSFYKMFGYPTGLGALVVRNDMSRFLQKRFIGGGTVNAIAVNPFYVSIKTDISDCLEDGTLPFQQIVSLDAGFDYIQNRFGNDLFGYCDGLMQSLVSKLKLLKHYNDTPVVELFREDVKEYGPILSFQVRDSCGSIIGYSQVMRLASLKKIHLRAGRFCNPGGAQHYLKLNSQEIMEMREAYGHVCGDGYDKIGQKATGALRISLGFCNDQNDVDYFVSFLDEYFKESVEVVDIPTVDVIECDLVQMYIYPIKSCGGLQVTNWPMGVSGLLYDRYFMLRDKKGNIMTQKKYPELKRISVVELDQTLKILKLKAPGIDILEIPLLNTGMCTETRICQLNRRGNEIEGNIQSWFQRFLKTECTLIQVPIKNDLSFANRAQFSLLSLTSVEAVKKKVPDSNHIDIHSFRPNFVIDSLIPFEENYWVGKTVKLNDHLFIVKERCERCQMICVDQEGRKHSEPLLTLAKQRVDVTLINKGQIVFGVYLQLIDNSVGKIM